MKLFLMLSFVICSTAFSQSIDTFWEIDRQVKTITTQTRFYGSKLVNKQKANEQMDEKLQLVEEECLNAGWNYSLISRQGREYRLGGRKGWRVTSVVSCSKNN